MSGWLYNRFLRLGIPYLIGIPFVVPLLVFPRYLFAENPVIGYWDFWRNIYFPEKIQGGGPFWVLFCFFLYSAILILFSRLLPVVMAAFHVMFRRMIARPVYGAIIFLMLSITILGLSDLRWGAPWWIALVEPPEGMGDHPFWTVLGLFRLQGSRFLFHGLYFIAGALFSGAGFPDNREFFKMLSSRWHLLVGCTIITGLAYIGYTLSFIHEGAYSDEILRFFRKGGHLSDIGQLLVAHAPLVLVRTSLQGIYVFAFFLALLAVFYRFFNVSTCFWRSLSSCSYGIFLLHEVPVIWLQYLLNQFQWPILFKITVIFLAGFCGTWGIVRLLRMFPGVARVL